MFYLADMIKEQKLWFGDLINIIDILFWVEERSSHSVPFLVSYLKNGSIPLIPFLVKECFHPRVLSIERLLKPGYLKKGGVQFVDF